MASHLRIVSFGLALALVTLSVVVWIAPPASALARTWTSDTDFSEPGAEFNGVEIVGGPGPGASLRLFQDETDWKDESPAVSPGPREAPSLAYAATASRTVLFGGYDGVFYLHETWEYDHGTNTWSQVTPATRPAGRELAAASYDGAVGIVVLFGGVSSAGTFRDTWEYDATTDTWTETTPGTSPPQLSSVAMAYDVGAARHILAGWNIAMDRFETWAYDAGANSWASRTTGGPANRAGHAMAYHEGRGRVVLYGGGHPLPLPQGTLFGDTWEYDYNGNFWSLTVPEGGGPPGRARHAMTYRPASQSVLLFGGSAGGTLLQDTWRYFDSGGGPTWEILTTVTAPPARRMTGLTFDTADDVAVLYGGVDATTFFEDTWTLGASYRSAGLYTSAVFDSGGATVDWQTVWFNDTPPANTLLRFQLAALNNDTGPWTFLGPNCLATSYYTTPGQAICPSQDGNRYLRFLAQFGTFDPALTPNLADLTVVYDVPPAPPYIVTTDPADSDLDVPVDKVVRIVFSEPMDTTSVSWTFLLGTPVPFTPAWSQGDSVLDLAHPGAPFRENTVYRLRIDGMDKQGDALVAGPVSNPFLFVTQATLPYVVSTSPVQGDRNVPLTASIVVTFSEPMDTSTLSWTISPNLTLNPQWNPSEDVLTFTHVDPFEQCLEYEVSVFARDKVALQLVPGPAPNPWTFTVECINPYLVETDPPNLQGDVALLSPVVVTFSEPMNPATVTFTISPDVGGKALGWELGNTRLNVTHTAVFTGCQVYTVTVTGDDVDGNPIIPGPPWAVPNPWKFITLCDNPYILLTDPKDGETNVTQSTFIRIAFSEQMDTPSVQYVIEPPVIVIQDRWSQNILLTIEHIGFAQCQRYTVTVTQGRNVAGFPLIAGPVPNPWRFDTVCESPYVTNTNPADGDVLVPLDAPIWVNFSEPMDPPTVAVAITPGISLTRTWMNDNTTLLLTHAANFADCTEYTVDVDGKGRDGNNLVKPGPRAPATWRFTTRCAGFYLIRTDPFDQQQNVPETASVVVEFSQPVDAPTFSIVMVPGVTFDPPVWSQGDTVVTLTHATPFQECKTYTATVDARNLTGSPLQSGIPGSAANPWTFKVRCIPPQITQTDPADGATNVPLGAPIIVTFSEPMDPPTVTWTIIPSIPLTAMMSGGNTVLTLSHTTPFLANTLYTIQVRGNDVDGNALVPGPVPNPWSFTTTQGLLPPAGLQVIRSPPNDILLTWRPVTGAIYAVHSVVNRFTAWPWPVLTTTTATSFFHSGAYSDGSPHYYIVRARDPVGTESPNSTMGVKLPISFAFNNLQSNVYWMSIPYRSMYKKASDISGELTEARIDVVGKWDPAFQRSVLWYFFRGQWRGVDFPLNPGDGFYLGVRSSFAWVVNGTDGAVPRTFVAYPPPNANVNWISLPYTHRYQRASDIVLDIEGSLGGGANTRIVEVAHWDPLTQSLVKFSWSPSGWSGTDFSLVTSEGLYLKVVAPFTWTPRLLTPEVP